MKKKHIHSIENNLNFLFSKQDKIPLSWENFAYLIFKDLLKSNRVISELPSIGGMDCQKQNGVVEITRT